MQCRSYVFLVASIDVVQDTTYMGTAEAADRLGISRSTLLRRVESGDIEPAIVVPGYRGHFLFHAADIEAMAAQS